MAWRAALFLVAFLVLSDVMTTSAYDVNTETAFPSGAIVTRSVPDISWETATPGQGRRCQDPGTLLGGTYTLTGYRYLDTVRYACNAHFTMLYPPIGIVWCKANGEWSHSKPTCKPPSCPDPVRPISGWYDVSKGIQRTTMRPFRYNDTVTWMCSIGYNTVGHNKGICQVNGTWSNSAPTCQRIICVDPGQPTN
eukprot:scpid102681/ scgid25774/ CUB and sushi domain-containing protein 3; CUB and sushi multiple domains protein 3